MADSTREAAAGATGDADFEADLTPQRYYRGTIIKLQEGSQRGVVLSASGRRIPFSFMFLTMLGPLRSYSDLHVGLQVGYDVSHTSNGLRISVIRIPDEAPGADVKG